jgi:DNA-directed RNA polymerase specialized sigma24 family protein
VQGEQLRISTGSVKARCFSVYVEPVQATSPSWATHARKPLVAFARGLLAHRGLPAADRDDVAQDVALVLFRRWPSYSRERGTPHQWVSGIVAVELRASARRRGRVLGDLVRELPEVLVESDVEPTVATQEILAAVPPAERRVIELCVEGHTYREVAAREGISASTALARHHRGLALARRTEVKRPPARDDHEREREVQDEPITLVRRR